MTALPPLPAPLSRALADKGYETLTPVQAAVLAPEVAGQDLLVSAQTGSGKTVAFGLAMADSLLGDATMMPPPDTARALVIAPTRELAMQVRREFEWLYGPAGGVIASCVGGMDARAERRALERGTHIVVGTPGRLRDHIERGALDLSTVASVALDEADEMLDLGFREDLEYILQQLPEERRTLLFSATVSPQIARLAQTYQKDAQRIATEASREQHGDISYRAMIVANEDAEHAIVNVLRFYEAQNALVFCKTRAAVNHLTARLLNRGFSVVPLSGELAQEERSRALQAMRDGRARVCVATDVAARGIDLPGLELVIHADLPSNKETLLHRSGRTGRAGRKGVSVLVVPSSARKKTERLLGFAGVAAEWGPAPTAAEVSARDSERLLSDAALTAPETEDEAALITQLTESFEPRALAAAVARLYLGGRSAPEDVVPITADGPKPRARAEFDRSFWIRLGVGHEQRAEPRWLLPMLCRAGDLTKADIGAIRIYQDHTLAQLHADCADRFWAAAGKDGMLEGEVSLAEAEAPAEGERPAPRPRSPRPEGDRPFKGRRDNDGDGYKPRGPKPEGARPYKARREDGDSGYKPRAPRPEGERPYKPRREDGDAPRGPRRDFDKKDFGKKDFDKGDRPEKASAPKPYGAKPRAADGDKPRGAKYDAKAKKPRTDGAPAKPRIDPEAARNPSARLGKPARKPAGKPGAKPFAKPGRPSRPKS
ncbi:DEAD/DEAH box helicase [Pararhodobacter marinus]|uniref:DEAD/DEAH box helicase n=1 Tax=Pararhodobacter marinus TaxID=2184063 RepID=UPI00351930F7